MGDSFYFYGSYVLFGLVVISILLAIWWGLGYAFDRLSVKRQKARQFLRWIAGGLFFWLVILALLAEWGFFANFSVLPPRVLLAVGFPVLIILLLLRSRLFSLLLQRIPMAWLIFAQVFRVLMELFLWFGHQADYIPLQMTFAWLNQDILVGITAPFAATLFFRRKTPNWFQVVIWNVFGLLLLVNVLLIGLLSAPTSFQVFVSQPDTRFVAGFPFIWIPGLIVPFAMALHVFSLKQVWLAWKGR